MCLGSLLLLYKFVRAKAATAFGTS